MPDRKRPEDIDPPRTGVKLKRRTPPVRKEPEKAQIISNVQSDSSIDQLPMPTEEAIRISNKINVARQQLIQAMQSFNKILSNCVLPENKSVNDKEVEKSIISDMTKAATEIDKYSNGEGTLALSIFAVRQAIFFRDAGNRLAYEIDDLKKRISTFEKNVPQEEQKKAAKNRVLELAKELGVDIKVDGKNE